VKQPVKLRTRIDAVMSPSDLRNFAVEIDSNYRHYNFKNIQDFKSITSTTNYCKDLADSAGVSKPFIKEDFDNNGYTDLIAMSKYENQDFNVFVVYSYGKEQFQIKPISRGSLGNCIYPKLKYIDGLPALTMFTLQENTLFKKINKQDLLFKYGGFIEYNSHPTAHNIESIRVDFSPCYGRCPIFEISIDEDLRARYVATEFNYKNNLNSLEDVKGEFEGKISPQTFKEICGLLNYIDFSSLKENYMVYHTDAPSIDLEIKYDNGQTKKISDYGRVGTYGLIRLYDIFSELRFTQNWK
jgi:hypothetical protein